MRDENALPGLTTGYAEADQPAEIKLLLLEKNRKAVEHRLDEIEQGLAAIERRWDEHEITLAELERHRKEAANARKRLGRSLQLLDLYIRQLQRLGLRQP